MLFKKAIKQAFKYVKKDFNALRYSMNEWVVFLNRNDQVLAEKINVLESKVKRLEAEKVIRIE